MNYGPHSTPPILSVKISRTGVGDWQTGFEFVFSISNSVNFNNEWRYTIIPHICVYGVISGMLKEIFYYFLQHAVHICTN